MPCSISHLLLSPTRLASCLVGLVLLFTTGCQEPPARPALDLPIFFTGDAHGRLEPCGCFTGQYGGLTRLKTVLDQDPSPDSLRLDVGDAIAGREDYDLILYRHLLRAFAAMDYDALNVGRREAMLSLAQLQDLQRASPVPILSANLLDPTSGQPIFPPYRVVQRQGYRIAIIGVVDPRGLEDDLGDGLQIIDMPTAITRALADLQSKPPPDLIVLLAFTDEPTLAHLARQFYELHVILGGRVRQSAQELQRENRSLISFVTHEARTLGTLHLKLQPNSPPTPIHHEIILLRDTIPQSPDLIQMAREYRDEVRHTPLAVDDPTHLAADRVPGVRAAAEYVGSHRCLSCHPSAAAVWAQSHHSSAFDSLVRREADADPNCVGCHTVGFGSPSGYRREFGDRQFVHVGCESCHGPGSLHVRRYDGEPTLEFTYRPLGEGDCRQCHYGEFSRPFDWDTLWPRIQHGKEPVKEQNQTPPPP